MRLLFWNHQRYSASLRVASLAHFALPQRNSRMPKGGFFPQDLNTHAKINTHRPRLAD